MNGTDATRFRTSWNDTKDLRIDGAKGAPVTKKHHWALIEDKRIQSKKMGVIELESWRIEELYLSQKPQKFKVEMVALLHRLGHLKDVRWK